MISHIQGISQSGACQGIWEYILDGILVYHKVPHTHTHVHTKVQVKVDFPPTAMFLGTVFGNWEKAGDSGESRENS